VTLANGAAGEADAFVYQPLFLQNVPGAGKRKRDSTINVDHAMPGKAGFDWRGLQRSAYQTSVARQTREISNLAVTGDHPLWNQSDNFPYFLVLWVVHIAVDGIALAYMLVWERVMNRSIWKLCQ